MKAVVVAAVGCVCGSALASDPWADAWVSYTPGAGVAAGYNVPGSALGEPTRFTGVGVFPGAVTPFNPAFLGSEVVSIGTGGSLVVRFNEPVTNDAANPFGVDLLLFGNAGYIDTNFPTGTAGAGMFGAGGGTVEVSADGTAWVLVPAAVADGAFPTLGYLDVTDPYATAPGAALSDFTRPVNPAFVATGLSYASIVAGYAGSGGGAGIDIGAVGLSSISYVRVTNAGAGTVEVDAMADVVPAPGSVGILLIGAAVMRRRR